MQYNEKELSLKNGQKAILRSPNGQDAQKMIDFLIKSAGETDFLLCYPEERAIPETVAEKMLTSVLYSPYDMMLSCFIDDKIVGNAQISFKREIKTAHRAMLALAVLKEYWGLGIGTALMEEMEMKAKTRCISRLELSVIEENRRARALYEKLGFTAIAKIPEAYRLKDGGVQNEMLMIKSL